MLFSVEIYTAGRIFTLPPAVMTVTNITSGILLITLCILENLQLPKLLQKIEYRHLRIQGVEREIERKKELQKFRFSVLFVFAL